MSEQSPQRVYIIPVKLLNRAGDVATITDGKMAPHG